MIKLNQQLIKNPMDDKQMLNQKDHDILIRVETRLEDLQKAVDNLRDGTQKTIMNHEDRINKLETSRTRQNVAMGIYLGIGTLLVSLLIYHIIGPQ
jgi:hypothetical protein